MKTSHGMFLGVILSLVFFAGYGFRSTFAQQSSGAQAGAEKLSADIHPETLSRSTRATKDEFKTNEDKQAYDRVMERSAKQKVSRWLGPTGTRLHLPVLAENYNAQIGLIHSETEKAGVDKKYIELAIAVATRETDNREEFLNHEPDAVKAYGQEVEDIIRTRKDTKGLDEKQAVIIQFGRELFHQPKVSSKTFADMERNFGKKGTLGISLLMCYYVSNGALMRVYDQHMDTNPDCTFPHSGCLSATHPQPSW